MSDFHFREALRPQKLVPGGCLYCFIQGDLHHQIQQLGQWSNYDPPRSPNRFCIFMTAYHGRTNYDGSKGESHDVV